MSAAYGVQGFEKASLHYLQAGVILEQRTGSITGNRLVFDGKVYLGLNRDLSNLTETQREIHWLRQGISEGRRAHLYFSSLEYLELYPDLSKAFGTKNSAKAISHYILQGTQE
ncbi:hypothetical protein [Methanothrix soehngenii]|uniref:hypothetical protein n=1 Tax=Methanothrix soehngenii TaxID=2223 RepID=UPI00300C11E0